MTEMDLNDLFFALNVAVMELTESGTFTLLSDAPPWMSRFYPALAPDQCTFDPENVFGFLENFLDESKKFWALEKVGSINSGILIEVDSSGKEYLFEATAVTTKTRKILIIVQNPYGLKEKQSLIQRGRELALNHQTLERSEKMLQQYSDILELRVKERTAELEKSNVILAEELEKRKKIEKEKAAMQKQLQRAQKMEAIGTLAGGIAHDFNNVLTAVIGFTELSLSGVDAQSPIHRNLQKVLSAATRAKELVRQILTFSRQTEEEHIPIKLKHVIQETVDFLRASLPTTIDIQHHLLSNKYVLADPTQMHQVIMNLCTNAGHAMQESGGDLTIRLQDLEISPEGMVVFERLKPGPYVKISVEDTGCGITPDVLDRIFDPFFTTKQKGKGTGMGLSVVHGIIRSSNGRITVESTPGEGAKFHIFLPAIPESVIPQVTEEDTPIRGQGRILFVDDDPTLKDLAIDLLGMLGYEVVALTDSIEALHLFSSQPENFDLVITDLTMPKMTGNVLAQELLKVRPNLPILLCSGYSESFSREEALALGIKEYLIKPVGMHEMSKTIRSILDS